eukprot:Em0014g928a
MGKASNAWFDRWCRHYWIYPSLKLTGETADVDLLANGGNEDLVSNKGFATETFSNLYNNPRQDGRGKGFESQREDSPAQRYEALARLVKSGEHECKSRHGKMPNGRRGLSAFHHVLDATMIFQQCRDKLDLKLSITPLGAKHVADNVFILQLVGEQGVAEVYLQGTTRALAVLMFLPSPSSFPSCFKFTSYWTLSSANLTFRVSSWIMTILFISCSRMPVILALERSSHRKMPLGPSAVEKVMKQHPKEMSLKEAWRHYLALPILLNGYTSATEDPCPQKKSRFANATGRVSTANGLRGFIGAPIPETETGSRYVLVAVDHFTKWAEAYGIPNQEAATVARKLVDEMFCRFSPLEQLHSDQGRQFESELVKEVCKLLEIKKTHTTPYHPQCNGIVERFNRTLLGMLATMVDSYPSSWEQNIRRVCLAYNSSVHASTGFSPFFLMFGRQVKLPVDLMYGTTQGKETAVMEYVKNLKDGLLEAYALVRDRCETEHKRQKSIYDRKVHGEPYSEGDIVWLYTPAVPSGQSRKLHRPWKGPYKVVERLGDATYKLQGTRGRRPQIVHFDRLKPCPPNVRLANEPRPEQR